MWQISNSCCCKATITPTAPLCGVNLDLTTDTYITNVCCRINFVLTITNDSSNTVYCGKVNLNTNKCLAIDPASITVNGQVVDNANPNSVDVGTIEGNSNVVINYQAVVMQCCRCLRYQVPMTFAVCCCFEQRCYRQLSNSRLIQVCCCCCNGNADTNTTGQ